MDVICVGCYFFVFWLFNVKIYVFCMFFFYRIFDLCVFIFMNIENIIVEWIECMI